jgi:hypothetical protein
VRGAQADAEAFTVVPNTELVVAREAYSSNTSKYFLNGKASNFTEVTEVFKAKGVDLDNNRFLILQARPVWTPAACHAAATRPRGPHARRAALQCHQAAACASNSGLR